MSFPVETPVSNASVGGDTPATTPVAATPATPAVSQPATPVVNPTPPLATGGGEAQVPSYRLRQQRDQYEQRIATMQAESQARYDQVQRQLQSLVGVTPPANPEIDQIKQQFGDLYSDSLAKLADPNVVSKLLALMERSGDLEAQTQHYWTTYGRQTMDRLFTKAGETLGGPLSDDGKRQLHAAFTGYVQSDPDLVERYSSDPTIVDDFWKAFSSNLIDPVRRTAAANVTDRIGQNLPQDVPGGAPRATPAPQPANLDERMNMAWQQYNKFAK
jgi:hypothetical protein